MSNIIGTNSLLPRHALLLIRSTHRHIRRDGQAEVLECLLPGGDGVAGEALHRTLEAAVKQGRDDAAAVLGRRGIK